MRAGRRAVFDCNIYLQAILNPQGPARQCLDAASAGYVSLAYSDFIWEELREVSARPKLRRKTPRLTDDRVESLIRTAESIGEHHDYYPAPYVVSRDPNDSKYIHLAISLSAACVVSRDKDLLSLNDPTRPEGAEFMRLYPRVTIMDPVALLTTVGYWPSHGSGG